MTEINLRNLTPAIMNKVYKDSERDYWMTAIDAKKYGMIDEIVTKRK